MPSRCVVFGCDNRSDRRERNQVMSHVNHLAFHSCRDPKNYKTWANLINRQDKAWKGMNASVKVCSNHFKLGMPLPASPHPVLYMKGYGTPSASQKRPPPRERSSDVSKPRKALKTSHRVQATMSVDHSYSHKSEGVNEEEVISTAEDMDGEEPMVCNVGPDSSSYSLADLDMEHNYQKAKVEVCDSCSGFIGELITSNKNMAQRIADLEREMEIIKSTNTSSTSLSEIPKQDSESKPKKNSPLFSIDDIKHSPSLVYLHTGVQNYETFKFILDEVSHGAENMHYYRGSESLATKRYQESNSKKPGKERTLSKENELLLTLTRIKLDIMDEHLAFLFGVSESTVSQIISTWIPLLSRELSGLIYWPTQEEILEAYPKCFSKFDTVRAIIDCTEVAVQKPSLASANSQIFSSYKNKPTAKFLIACTPAGSISFVSDPAGGRMSDKEITNLSGICDLFQPGDVCLADRGFTIQDLLLPQGARLVIPPFTNKGKQFTKKKAAKTKEIANARIHIERVINRWKDFKILQGTVPLNMMDLLGHIGKICGALVNLLPSIVPLS